mmetsp:Transcript_27846/g.68830  ORF Transcript_27846/g.68830 Transcript_27846/m.68830 type:complete len:208 (+) Transcript_27846:164-787(+)
MLEARSADMLLARRNGLLALHEAQEGHLLHNWGGLPCQCAPRVGGSHALLPDGTAALDAPEVPLQGRIVGWPRPCLAKKRTLRCLRRGGASIIAPECASKVLFFQKKQTSFLVNWLAMRWNLAARQPPTTHTFITFTLGWIPALELCAAGSQQTRSPPPPCAPPLPVHRAPRMGGVSMRTLPQKRTCRGLRAPETIPIPVPMVPEHK